MGPIILFSKTKLLESKILNDNKIEMFNTRLINSLLFLNLTALTLFNYNEVTTIIKQ